MNSRTRIIAIIGAVAVAAVGLTGCVTTAGEAPPAQSERLAGSLAELFQQERGAVDNDFVIEVLDRAIESGTIAQSDYDEAHKLYAECMKAAGYEESYRQDANGLWRITPPPLSGQDEVEKYMTIGSDCSDELAPIEALFAVQQGNPDLLADPRQAAVQCLREAQLVGADYTVEDFDSEFETRFESAPYDPNAPDAQACLSGAGFAVTVEG
jgi:hypothetical protein